MGQRRFLLLLFVINLLGTLYGYYWYRYQLAQTPLPYLPFVPDSPTASLFFTIVLWLYLRRRNNPYIEAFAAVTLFKYGIWAVAAIFAGAWLLEPSIASHAPDGNGAAQQLDACLFPYRHGHGGASFCPLLFFSLPASFGCVHVGFCQRFYGLCLFTSPVGPSVLVALHSAAGLFYAISYGAQSDRVCVDD